MKSKINEIIEGLQHFHGSEMIYQIALTQTRYTDGIKYLANAVECHWLITDASIIAKSLIKKSSFITVDFKRLPKDIQVHSGYGAEFIYGDGNDNLLESYYRFPTGRTEIVLCRQYVDASKRILKCELWSI